MRLNFLSVALKSLVLAQLAEKAMILGIGMLTVQEERR